MAKGNGIPRSSQRVARRHFEAAALMAMVSASVMDLGCAFRIRRDRSAMRLDSMPAQTGPVSCSPRDSSVECCLKQNPGQYERCGATPPQRRPAPKKPAPVDPPPRPPPPPDDPPGPDKDRCGESYDRCVAAGGESLPGRVHGETRCGSCLNYCTANGFWPLAIYTWSGRRLPCPQ
jgi:hypothetical protein